MHPTNQSSALLPQRDDPNVCTVLSSVYSIMYITINVFINFTGPFLFFLLVFSQHSPFYDTPQDYPWNSLTVVSVMVASPILVSLLCATLTVGMPEALEGGTWTLLGDDSASQLLRILPFLRPRPTSLRHFLLGICLAVPAVPAGLLLAKDAVGPVMSANAFWFFGPVYIACLALVLTPISLLGFAVPANFERVAARMPTGTMHPVQRASIGVVGVVSDVGFREKGP